MGTRCSKRKNASAVLTGRCDVVSDWAACSVITTAPPHRSSGAPAGRNGWSGGEVCSGAPIADPVPRRLVSANLENASRIRAFGSVHIFGHDGLVSHSHRKRGETDRPRLRSTAPALDSTGLALVTVFDPVLCQNSAQPASTKEPCLSKSNSSSSTRTGYAAAANI